MTTDTTAPFDCVGAPQTSGPLTLTPLTTNHNEDSAESLAVLGHADPCTDYAELGEDEALGGLRDPFNPYDFFDTNGDGTIAVTDYNAVVSKFGLEEGDPGYEPSHDRGLSVGPNGWNRLPPDGTIAVADVFAIVAQFGHEC